MVNKKSLVVLLGLIFLVGFAFLVNGFGKNNQAAQVAGQNSISVAAPANNATFSPGQNMTLTCNFTTDTGGHLDKLIAYRWSQTGGSADFFSVVNPSQTGSYGQQVLWPANSPLGQTYVGCTGYFSNTTTGVYETKFASVVVNLAASGPVDAEVPTAPTNPQAGSISQTSAALSWTASTDNTAVTGYKVYNASTNAEIANVTTGTSHTWSGLTANTAYSFYVKAYDAVGNLSSASTTKSFSTLSATQANQNTITAVAPLASSNLYPGQSLTMTCNANIASGYNLYKVTFSGYQSSGAVTQLSLLSSPDQGGVYTRTVTIPASSVVNKPMTLDCMGEYWNAATSHYEQKHGLVSVNIVSGTTPPPTGGDTQAPATPAAPSITYRDSTKIDLAWTATTDNVGVSGYKVLRSVNGGTFAQVATGVTGLTYSNTGLSATNTYSYKIQAYDAAGNNSTQSTTTTAPTLSTLFSANSQIITTATVNVRQTAGGTVVGNQITGMTGTIVGSVAFSGGFQYWNVNFLTGVDGWVAEDFIEAYIPPVTPPTDTIAPSTPAGLTIGSATSSSLTLNWNDSTDSVGVVGYKVFRSTSATGPFAQVGSSTTSDYVNTGLSASTTYYYYVTANDLAGNNSIASITVSGATSAVTPPPPTATVPNTPSTQRSVQLSATVQSGTPRVTLNWATVTGRSGVGTTTIKRKEGYTSTSWTTIGTAPSTATSFADTSAQANTYYEYRVEMPTSVGTAYGYIASGVDLASDTPRGKIILVVDNTFQTSLANQIQTLVNDLNADKWVVLPIQYVSRDATPTSVRTLIKNLYDANTNVKAVYLLGHVPVASLGNVNPDGHASRGMSSDGLYAEMNSTWNTVSGGCSGYTWNPQQAAGIDTPPTTHRFCHGSLPSDAELQVGRVDGYKVTAFGGTETTFLSNYLTKAHNFKTRQFVPLDKAIIRDFFAANGWNSAKHVWGTFPSVVGANNVTSNNAEFPHLDALVNNQSHMFVFGNYYGANAEGSINDVVGSTAAAAASSWDAVFNMAYGSYFGEWDGPNAFMKSLIGSGDAMGASYGGDRNIYLHAMGMGQTIGYSFMKSVNNTSAIYTPVGGVWGDGYTGNGYMTLFGDPTVRMKYVAVPTSLNFTNTAGKVGFSWGGVSGASGYNIYEIQSSNIRKVNTSLITGTSYTSNDNYVNGVKYMVTAQKPEVGASGSYLNESLGRIEIVGQ